MREPGWIIGAIGALAGGGVIAYALLIAEFAGGPDTSALGDRLRMVLVGLVIATIALAVGAAVRHKDRWTTHVFIGLGALAAVAAVWWAIGQLIG